MRSCSYISSNVEQVPGPMDGAAPRDSLYLSSSKVAVSSHQSSHSHRKVESQLKEFIISSLHLVRDDLGKPKE
jgi:hypothetical protein